MKFWSSVIQAVPRGPWEVTRLRKSARCQSYLFMAELSLPVLTHLLAHPPPNCSGGGGGAWGRKPWFLKSTISWWWRMDFSSLLPTVGEHRFEKDLGQVLPSTKGGSYNDTEDKAWVRHREVWEAVDLVAGGLGSSWTLPLASPLTLFSCNGTVGILNPPPPVPKMLALSGIMDMKTSCELHDTFKMFCYSLGGVVSSAPQLCRCPQWL